MGQQARDRQRMPACISSARGPAERERPLALDPPQHGVAVKYADVISSQAGGDRLAAEVEDALEVPAHQPIRAFAERPER